MKNLLDIFCKDKDTEPHYRRLFHEYYPFIQKQCHQIAAKMNFSGRADDASLSHAFEAFDGDDLQNRVLERLTKDNYKVIRDFAGRSKMTTYLITIIQHEAYDLRRQMSGRDRSRERAQKLGSVAEVLHDLVCHRGYNLNAAREHIESTMGIVVPFSSLETMLAQIRGRGPLHHGDGSLAAKEIGTDHGMQAVWIDPGNNPEENLCDQELKTTVDKVLSDLMKGLTGEEKLMIRMRFPAEGEKPKTMQEIGKILGCTEKAVDGRIRRILIKFRENLLGNGLGPSDII